MGRSFVGISVRPVLLAAAVLLLAGCMTGYGGYPGSYGQSSQGYPYPQGGQYANQLVGTVLGVDRRYHRIVLSVQDRGGHGGYGGHGGEQVSVEYDHRTRLFYQGRQAAIEGLERGDVIRVEADGSRGRLLARSIEVLRNVRDGAYGPHDGYGGGYDPGYGQGYGQGNELRGSVVLVDPRARVVRLNGAGYGGGIQVRYDSRTVVEYRGNRYRPENLERGDIVRVLARRYGNDWLAERIFVERDSSPY